MNNYAVLTERQQRILHKYVNVKTADGYTFAVFPCEPENTAAVSELAAFGLLEYDPRNNRRVRITADGLARVPDSVVNPPRVAVDWPTVYGGWRGCGGRLTDLQRLANGGYPVNERKW